MNLPVNTGILLINKAVEQQNRDEMWSIWIAKYQHMDKDNYIAFDDFWKPVVISRRSTAEILREAEEIRARIEVE